MPFSVLMILIVIGFAGLVVGIHALWGLWIRRGRR